MFAVVIEHYVPNRIYLKQACPLGWQSGVTLFFVLSGFLITGILLRCRDTINSTGQSTEFTLQRFYIRRFLRIIPIYILALAAAALFSKVRTDMPWQLTCTTNFMVVVQNAWDQYATHFWSLAMEEQFYLVWPFVILLLPQKHLLKAILITIMIVPLFRLIGYYALNLSPIQIFVFPLLSLDALGLGSLLAFYAHNHDEFKHTRQALCRFGLLICLPLLICFKIVFFEEVILLDFLIKLTFMAFFYVWLIGGAAEGFGGVPGKILELKPPIFIGKISYGLYIYHYFMTPIFKEIMVHYHLPNSTSVLAVFALLKVTATFAIAIPSWFLIEQPINNFKEHFSYKKRVAV